MAEKNMKNYTVLDDIEKMKTKNNEPLLCNRCHLNDKDEPCFSFSCSYYTFLCFRVQS